MMGAESNRRGRTLLKYQGIGVGAPWGWGRRGVYGEVVEGVAMTGEEKMYCARCGVGSPMEANFCMSCGAPQKGEVLQQRLAEITGSYRRMARWLMGLAGVGFMWILLSGALRSMNPPWREPTFWVAVVGIVVACVIVPQVVWREKGGKGTGKKDALARLVGLAPTAMWASVLLLLWWGGRVVNTLTLGSGAAVWGAAIFMMAGNAALVLGLAKAIESSAEVKPGWERARRLTAVLIAATVIFNGVAELVWYLRITSY